MLNASPLVLLIAVGCLFVFLCPSTLSALPTREKMTEAGNKKPFKPPNPSKRLVKFVYKRDEFLEMELEEGKIPAWIGKDGLMRVPSAFSSTVLDLDNINGRYSPTALRKKIDHHNGVVLPGISPSNRFHEAEKDPYLRLREFVPSLRDSGRKPAKTITRTDPCRVDCIAGTLSTSITNSDGSDIFFHDLFGVEYVNVDVTNVPVPTGCSFADDPYGYLICDNPSMTVVPKDLPHQFPFSIFEMKNTSVEVLSHGDFNLLDVLEMKLEDNMIQRVEPGAFFNISSIVSLSLKRNLIPSLDWQVFEGLDTLLVLSLRANQINLTDQFNESSIEIPPVFLPRLSYLDLAENPLGHLNEHVFSHFANSNITELNLKSCSLVYIHENAFKPLTSLEHVDLFQNPDLMSKFTFDILPSSVIRLGLGFNRLVQKLPGMTLSGNTNNYTTNLKILNLTSNFFFFLTSLVLPADLFPDLQALVMEDASISIINDTAFRGLAKLAYLYLGNNQLTEIAPGAFPSSLFVLSLRQNPQVNDVFSLSKDNLAGMPMLYWLDMNLMKLDTKNLSSSVFNGLNQLIFLQMRNSGLDMKISRLFSPLSKLRMLDLGQNDKMSSLEEDFFVGLSQMQMIFIDCNCNFDFNEDSQDVGNENYQPFRWMPHLAYLGLSSNSIKQFTPNLVANLKELSILDLSDNYLKTWVVGTTASTPNITAIDVSSNQIVVLPNNTYEEFYRIEAIDLSNNALTCNCQTLDLQLLANSSNVTVLNWEVLGAYDCTDFSADPVEFKHIQTMAEEEFQCEDKNNLPPVDPGDGNHTVKIVSSVAIAMIAVVILVVIIGVVYVKRYKGNRKNWFYFRDHLFGGQKVDENEYEYDAFISFCEHDRPWVYTHLVPKLEPAKDSTDFDTPSFRLCLHDRDFVVGQQITENIIDNVAKSRKVVIVLSRSFVESKWCQFELHLSQHRLLETERRDALFLIVLEEVPKQKQSAGLRYLMSTRTYLAWKSDPEDQRLFWQRLCQVLKVRHHDSSPPVKTST